jgi:hypothetical protein
MTGNPRKAKAMFEPTEEQRKAYKWTRARTDFHPVCVKLADLALHATAAALEAQYCLDRQSSFETMAKATKADWIRLADEKLREARQGKNMRGKNINSGT